MTRPCKSRRVTCIPHAVRFVPGGTDGEGAEKISLTRDELEAIRLADYEELYQEQASKRMQVSRQTFGNIITAAHRKIADFLINAKVLSVEGGNVVINSCRFVCRDCRHDWSVPRGKDKPGQCPRCRGGNICCSKSNGLSSTTQTCWRNQ